MLNNKPVPPILIEDFGYLYPTATSKQKARCGLYRCGCGTEFKAQIASIKNGHTTSCGCQKKHRLTTHGLWSHPIYKTWKSMIGRTTNHKHFKYYGARGITVCKRWLDIHNFIEDMYPTYKAGLTIDRIDNDKGYSKDNCRWATREVQSRNTRKIMSTNTSGYRGVSWNKANQKWRAHIKASDKQKYLGSFDTALEAAIVYDKYVIANNFEHTKNGVVNQNGRL